MKKGKMILKRYRFALITMAAVGVLLLLQPQIGMKAIQNSTFQLQQMFFVIPPIFLLLGLLDVWVPKTTMVKYMGEGSGIKGILLSFLIGSAAAGPLYGAFPVAAVFMKKGIKFSNLMIFIGAWSTMKIPMFLFEMGSLGVKFALTRLAVDIPGILMIANTLQKMLTAKEVEEIYQKAETLLD